MFYVLVEKLEKGHEHDLVSVHYKRFVDAYLNGGTPVDVVVMVENAEMLPTQVHLLVDEEKIERIAIDGLHRF